MRVGFGRTLPKGRLPVFSVDTEEEAKQLITLCCPRDDDGQYYARELAVEQSLENLQRFSDKLAEGYAYMQAAKVGLEAIKARTPKKPDRRATPRDSAKRRLDDKRRERLRR